MVIDTTSSCTISLLMGGLRSHICSDSRAGCIHRRCGAYHAAVQCPPRLRPCGQARRLCSPTSRQYRDIDRLHLTNHHARPRTCTGRTAHFALVPEEKLFPSGAARHSLRLRVSLLRAPTHCTAACYYSLHLNPTTHCESVGGYKGKGSGAGGSPARVACKWRLGVAHGFANGASSASLGRTLAVGGSSAPRHGGSPCGRHVQRLQQAVAGGGRRLAFTRLAFPAAAVSRRRGTTMSSQFSRGSPT